MPVKKDVYVCKICQRDCGTPQGLKWHMQKHQQASTEKATTTEPAERTEPQLKGQATVTTTTSATGTTITVKPTIEITDPFLSSRVESPSTIDTSVGSGRSTKQSDVAEASVKPSTETTVKPLTESSTKPSTVEPQKRMVPATVGATTAFGTPIQLQLPPIHINIPSIQQATTVPAEKPSTEGHRDQLQSEAAPSIMMPLQGITREIEVTTKGMEIQIGSTVLMYYDWLRSRGYGRTFSEFVNQTVEAYFAEKGLLLGITFRKD